MMHRAAPILAGLAFALASTVAVRDVRADGFKVAKDIFCGSIGIGICPVVELVADIIYEMDNPADPANKGNVLKAFESLLNKFKRKVEQAGEDAKRDLDGLFKGLKDFLTIRHEKDFPAEAWTFAQRVFGTVNSVTKSFTKLIGLPDFIGAILGAINGGTVAVTVCPAVVGLALVNLGARKLFEWLLPELILGIGAMGAGAKAQEVGGTAAGPDGAPATAPPGGDLFRTILETLKKFAGPVAGGLIGILVKDKKKRERIQAVLEKIAAVAGKIEHGLSAVLALSSKIAAGKFDEVEQSLINAGKQSVPKELTPEQIKNMIDGLLDFVGDEIWALVHPPLNNLLGKGMALLDNLFGIPRGILVGAIGAIPFIGGVIASAINFGLGIVVGMIKDFLTKEVEGLAKFILDDVIAGLKIAFHDKVFQKSVPVFGLIAPPGPAIALTRPQQRIRAAVRRNPGVAALATSLGNAVDDVRRSLRTASLHHQSTVRALVMTAMKDLLLRGVASRDLREMVTAALGAIAPRFTEPGFSLAKGVGVVLSRIEIPLGQLLEDTVSNPRIRGVLQKGLAAIVRGAATEREAARLGGSMEGVLTRLGAELIDRVRPELVALLVGEQPSPALREIVAREVDAFSRNVRGKGFGSLLRFGQHFHSVVSRATKTLTQLLLAELDDPTRDALADHQEELAYQVAAEVLGASGAGKNLVTVIVETARRRIVDRVIREGGLGLGVAVAP